MKAYFSLMAIAFTFLTNNALAESEAAGRTNYPYLNAETYVFGTETATSKTFVYDTTLNDEQVLRLEFNVESFPFEKHFELGEFSQVYDKLMPEIRHQPRCGSVQDRYLTPIKQTVDVTIKEVEDGLFDTSLSVNTVAGLTTAPSHDGYNLLAFTNAASYISKGDFLSSEKASRSESETEDGVFKREWYVLD